MKKYISSITLFGLFISGCATTDTVSQRQDISPPPKIGNGKFVNMYGGLGEVHKYSGLTCENQLADMQFEKSYLYDNTGEDISCGWRGGKDRRYVTLYATRYPEVFEDIWQDTISIVNTVETERGLSFDKEKSNVCTLTALLGATKDIITEETDTYELFVIETAVFTSETITSVVTSHPAADHWVIKIRSTYPQNAGKTDENKYIEMCSEASDITRKQSANISKAGWK